MADLVVKDPPEFTDKIHKTEKTEYITADLENEIKGALLNNTVFLKKLAEAIKKVVDEHVDDTAIHVTPESKETWDAKASTDVATQTQKGLMGDTDKKKLDNIEEQAEANQNAYSNIKIGNTTVAAGGKTATLTLEAGDNITLVADNASKKVTIKANRDNGNADTVDGYHATDMTNYKKRLGDNYVMKSSDFDRIGFYEIGSLADSPSGNAPANNTGDYKIIALNPNSDYQTLILTSPRLNKCYYVGHFWNKAWQGWSIIKTNYSGETLDFNDMIIEGEYHCATNCGTANGAPYDGYVYGKLFVFINDSTGKANGSGNWLWQLLLNTDGCIYHRKKINNGAWSNWAQFGRDRIALEDSGGAYFYKDGNIYMKCGHWNGWLSDWLNTKITASYLDAIPKSIVFSDQTGQGYRGVQGVMAGNDYWRIAGGDNGTDNGFLEISTSDNGTEPIIVSQYTASSSNWFANKVRQAQLLASDGASYFPVKVEAPTANFNNYWKSGCNGTLACIQSTAPSNTSMLWVW